MLISIPQMIKSLGDDSNRSFGQECANPELDFMRAGELTPISPAPSTFLGSAPTFHAIKASSRAATVCNENISNRSLDLLSKISRPDIPELQSVRAHLF
jgi:hypothetical protein